MLDWGVTGEHLVSSNTPSQCQPTSHSEEEEYDSEEERFRARQAAASRATRIGAKAQTERERLGAFRERQRLEREAGVPGATSGRAWADAAASGTLEEDRHTAPAPAPSDALLTRLRSDIAKWDRLYGAEGSPPDAARPVPSSHIPWLPCDAERYLQCLALVLERGAPGPPPAPTCKRSGHDRALRRAYARACLWWHPDKFAQRVGWRLAAAEREAVLARVQDTFQAVSGAWAGAGLRGLRGEEA
ncbi:hypothetical protein ACKKBF_B02720 [Auxenochlorella protothecoides x Auxenochlorella symbiontica]